MGKEVNENLHKQKKNNISLDTSVLEANKKKQTNAGDRGLKRSKSYSGGLDRLQFDEIKENELIPDYGSQEIENDLASQRSDLNSVGLSGNMLENANSDQNADPIEDIRQTAKEDEIERLTELFAGSSGQAELNRDGNTGLFKSIESLFAEEREGSASFMQFKDSVNRFKEILSPDGDKSLIMDAAMYLAENAAAYCDSHSSMRMTIRGSRRKQLAIRVRDGIRSFIHNMAVIEHGNQVKGELANILEANEMGVAEKKKITERIKTLDKKFRSFSDFLSQRECSEVSAIRDKLVFFSPYAEDIKIYKALHAGESDRWPYAVKEYDFYVLQNKLLDMGEEKEDVLNDRAYQYARETDEKKEEKKIDPAEVDGDLSKEQLEGIKAIDEWFVRNFDNGGAAGVFLGMVRSSSMIKSKNGDIVTNLFRLTKRERLFIYYLIETNSRKNPDIYHVYNSQTDYIPNLDSFKSRMLATKLKVVKHMTGNYVYMNKLEDALAVNEDYKTLIKDYKSLDRAPEENEQETQARQEREMAGLSEDERNIYEIDALRMQHLKDVYRGLRNLANVEKELKNTKDKNERKGLENQARDIRDSVHDYFINMVREDTRLGEAVEEYNGRYAGQNIQKSSSGYKNIKDQYDRDKGNNRTEVMSHLGYAAKGLGKTAAFNNYIYDFGSAPVQLLIKGKPFMSWKLSGSVLVDSKYWGEAVAGQGFAALGSLLTGISAAYNLSKASSGMHAGDVGYNIITILNQAGDITAKIWDAVEKGTSQAKDFADSVIKGSKYVQSAPLRALGIATATAGMALGTYNVISGALDKRNTARAADYLKEKHDRLDTLEGSQQLTEADRRKQKQARFEKNIMALSKSVSDRKMVSGAMMAAGSAVALVSVLIPGVGLVTGIIGGILTGIAAGIDAYQMIGIQKNTFDAYFNVDGFYETIERELLNQGRKIYNKEKYKDSIRVKLAAAAGYANVKNASYHIAGQYADMILQRLFNENEEWEGREKEGYIQMIKSFGLSFDAKKKKPSRDRLIRKMTGR